MPIYRYVCSKEERCTLANLSEEFFEEDADTGFTIDLEDTRFTELTEDGKIDVEKSVIVQLVSHTMAAKPEVKCPACGADAKRVIGRALFYFPGNCFLNKADCKRQMALHKLKNDDPYGHMRPEGDKEFLIKKLERGNKAPAKNFYPGGKGGLSAPKQHRPGT